MAHYKTHAKDDAACFLASARIKKDYGSFEINDENKSIYNWWFERYRRYTLSDMERMAGRIKEEYSINDKYRKMRQERLQAI